MRKGAVEPLAFLTAAVFLLQSCASVTRAPVRAIAVTAAVTEAAAPTEESAEETSLPPARRGMNDRGAETTRAYDPSQPLLTRITGLRPAVSGFTAQDIPSRQPTYKPISLKKVIMIAVVGAVVFVLVALLLGHEIGKLFRTM